MKKCTKCKQHKQHSDFHKNRAQKDGFANQCKDCYKEYKARDRSRMLKRASDKRWYNNGGKEIILERQRTPTGKKRKAKLARKYRLSYPEKLIAQDRLIYAVRSGKIERPNSCQKCQAECTPHGHHWNGYDPAHYLDVEWLCQSCHAEVHRKPYIIRHSS